MSLQQYQSHLALLFPTISYSETKNGRILISSECLNLNSKEYDVNVVSAILTNFEISAERIHDYADGNQITSFSTSIIKDKQDNIVSDGTFVTFYITNSKGSILKTTGTTTSGVATSKMIHPDYKETWNVKAFVEGIAKSNSITITYKQAVKDFDIVFSEKNTKAWARE